MKKKKYIVLCVTIFFVITTSVLFSINNRIDEKQLVGAWYLDGDDDPYFKLKQNGKAKVAFSIVTDEDGNIHAGICDTSCKWKIKNGHLVLLSITDIDIGEIISIEDDVMICDKNGTIQKYVRKDLGMYDFW